MELTAVSMCACVCVGACDVCMSVICMLVCARVYTPVAKRVFPVRVEGRIKVTELVPGEPVSALSTAPSWL